MMSKLLIYTAIISVGMVSGCAHENQPPSEPEPVAFALDGTPLFPPPESVAARALKDTLLSVAETNYHQDSTDLLNIIWYGRRLAYLSRYPEAVDVYTRGLHTHPGSPHLLRHRGHRYITTRKFDKAIDDLTEAAAQMRGMPVETEPDGIPNALNTPLSTLQFNVWYHLGLAHYLNGANEEAAVAYDSCMVYSANPDLLTATADWYYMTLIRLGREGEAQVLLDSIPPDLEVIENDGYLQRLMMYKGLLKPEQLINLDQMTEENQLQVVTPDSYRGYGVANYFIQQGDTLRGNRLLREILKTDYWPAFGYIAAEADVYRDQK